MVSNSNLNSKNYIRWWEDQGIVRQRISGVFEGGGAKGILYAGALRALLKEGYWFDAVSGASAGAITATMIAAGLKPDQMVDEMDKALETLRMPGLLNGILRVREGASFFNQKALMEWLTDLLDCRFKDMGVERGDISFSQLFRITGIELNIVAVDLRRERTIVFNHRLTPDCQVASAAGASAAIPLVYEWMPLILPNKPLGVVVDGGVSANFPAFVFTDKSFREWAKLPAQDSEVLGFLLDEGEDFNYDEYHEAKFIPSLSEINPKLSPPRFRPKSENKFISRFLWIISLLLRIIFWPFIQFFFRFWPWILERNSTVRYYQTWEQIPNRPAREVIRMFDRILVGVHPWFLFVSGFVLMTLAIGYSIYEFPVQWWLIGLINNIRSGDISVIGAIAESLGIIASISALLYSWVVLVIVFIGASILHRSIRVTGYGLVRTFLKGPGAPVWTGYSKDDKVVRIEVPDGISTLGIDTTKVNRDNAIDTVEQSTNEQIRKILNDFK